MLLQSFLSCGIVILLSLFTYANAADIWIPPSSVNKLMESSDSGSDLKELGAQSRSIGRERANSAEANGSIFDSVAHPPRNVLELKALRHDNESLRQATKIKTDENLRLNKKIEDLTSQLTHLNSKLLEEQVSFSELESSTRKQETDRKNRLKSATSQIHDLTEQITTLKSQLASRPVTILPNTDEQRKSYVVGQAMAVSLRAKLNGYAQSGLKLERGSVLSGLTDGLIERMQLPKQEMDQLWSKFSDDLRTHIEAKVKESELFISNQTVGRKPALSSDGLQYFLVKRGSEVKDSNTPRVLSLSEINTADQRVISQVPRLVLGNEDEMPTIIRDALPLLGPGSEVEVYALARTIYGERPLPKGIAPFSVLHYRMKGLEPTGN